MPEISGTVVRLTDLLPSGNLIDGYTFRDCTIVGPAVILPLDAVVFEQCAFEGDPDAIAWEIPLDRPGVVGVIAINRCRFSECRLTGIGIAGRPDQIAEFKAGIGAPSNQADMAANEDLAAPVPDDPGDHPVE